MTDFKGEITISFSQQKTLDDPLKSSKLRTNRNQAHRPESPTPSRQNKNKNQ